MIHRKITPYLVIRSYMALSFKGLASSVSGKLLTGALALGAGNTIAQNTEATEITKITQDAAKLCIGSDMGGFITGEVLGWKGTVTDGVSTELTTTNNTAFVDQEYNPSAPQIGVHRNYSYTQYPANNDITEGYYLYDITDVNNVQQALVINSKNYPGYENYMRISFIKGATPDKDRMIFLGNTISVYKSPFDATGKVKPACKTGPEMPEFTYKYNFSAPSMRATGNFIFLLDGPNNPKIQKLIVGQNAITEDKMVILNGISASDWGPIHNGFITTKGANGKETTCLAVRGYDNVVLVNTDNVTDYIVSDATHDIAVEDPAGRFIFKSIDNGSGTNVGNLDLDTYITDSWAKPSTSKKILSKNIWPLQGNLAYAEGYPTPAWVLYGSNGKAYLIELTNAATMTVKTTEVPFDTFYNKYAGGGQACVTIPGQVPTITKTGTPADAGDANVVEKDAGGTEVDAGSTDGGNDADAGSTDAVDAWVDGKGDMQDIFADVPPTPDAPDTTDTAPDAPDVAPDQSVPEADGFTNKDAPDEKDTPKNDADETKQEVDVVIAPPDVGNPVGTDGAVGTDSGADTTGGPETKPGADAGSSDTSPTIKNTPPPEDTGCSAGSNGNASPFVIAAGVALAVGLARKKEDKTVKVEQ